MARGVTLGISRLSLGGGAARLQFGVYFQCANFTGTAVEIAAYQRRQRCYGVTFRWWAHEGANGADAMTPGAVCAVHRRELKRPAWVQLRLIV